MEYLFIYFRITQYNVDVHNTHTHHVVTHQPMERAGSSLGSNLKSGLPFGGPASELFLSQPSI